MDIGGRNARKHSHNFGDGDSPLFMPSHNVHHANPVTSNARPAATDPWRFRDMLRNVLVHKVDSELMAHVRNDSGPGRNGQRGWLWCPLAGPGAKAIKRGSKTLMSSARVSTHI